eukprot:EG_transcript_6625
MTSFGGFSFGVAAAEDDHDDHDDSEVKSPNSSSLQVPVSRGRRQTVSAEVYDASKEEEEFHPEEYPKSAEDAEKLTKILESHYLFKHLDDRELAKLVQLMEPKAYAIGDSLCEDQASADTSLFHVVVEGECDVKVDGNVSKTLVAGDTCGETEMMYTQPRTEFFIAKTPVRTFCIDRKTYQRTLHSTFAGKRALYCEFLRNVKFLEGMSQREIVQLADCLEARKFKAGEHVLYNEAPPEAMYIIMEGTVKVVGRDDKNKKIDVCEFGRGAIVGEMEFLHEHNNVADVVAKSDEVRTARLERKHFELCMGSLKDLLKSSRKLDPVYSYYHQKRAMSTPGDAIRDPEKGTNIDVTSNRLPYTYAGQVKSLMRDGEDRVTLNALGRASETAITTANRLRDAKFITLFKVETFLSARGIAGIRITLEKAADFDALLKEAEARDTAAKEKAADEKEAKERREEDGEEGDR